MMIEKVQEAQNRIEKALGWFNRNQCYGAYSGGKDSRAVLQIVRSVYPNVLVIHNGHAGEDIGDVDGVLCVKEPKAAMVPIFLQTVDLKLQFDGTRKDEDKTVIFEGQEIHRSKMPGWSTSQGVFGLNCVFPIWDWTEEEVFEYLRNT